MGVPTITLPGEIFASRHSASHISNAGLGDWVTDSVDEYIEMAVARAADPTALANPADPPCGTRCGKARCATRLGFGRNLGAALRKAWRAWCLERGQTILSSVTRRAQRQVGKRGRETARIAISSPF